jgi:hypothetical protein
MAAVVMTIQEIATAAGTTVADLVEDYGNVVYDLAGATFIGQMQLALGLPAGQALVDESAGVMADLSEFLGIDIADLGPLETGAATSMLTAARTYLKAGAKTVATTAKGSASGVVKAIVAIGLTAGSYMWMTEDLQVRLADVDLKKEIGAAAVAKLTAAQAADVVDQLTSPAPFSIPWWGWAALAAGGLAAYRYYDKGRG